MDNDTQERRNTSSAGTSRRTFLRQSTAAALGAGVAAGVASWARQAHAGGNETIRIGLVGCGGRGSGAAAQALRADPNTRLVAMADAFRDRLDRGLQSLRKQADVGERVSVERERQFTGFDAYQQVIASDVDVVLLATPPHFRPMHLKACIDAGKHVFAEKPVAVDAAGVRSVMQTTELARKKGLCIVSGLNSRYSHVLQELVRRIHDGAVGDLLALHAARYGGGVWVRPREASMTEMQYQMRNWYYFTWLSGDFNVEQFVHQLDFLSWLLGEQHPVRCYATGGRQSRTGAEYGHIFDHFSTVFEYASGVRAFTTTRHQRGCSNERQALVLGDQGTASLAGRGMEIRGPHAWEPPRVREKDSHQLEHDAFFAALRRGEIINNGTYMAQATLMAIMSRESAYTGQSLTWEQILNSQQRLVPADYSWDALPPKAEVAIPGVTKFV